MGRGSIRVGLESVLSWKPILLFTFLADFVDVNPCHEVVVL